MQNPNRHPSACEARHLTITGQVQGVGFRPFVFRLAHQHNINGWVQNRRGEVLIFAEASTEQLDPFIYSLLHEAPPLAKPVLTENIAADAEGLEAFTIKASDANSVATVHVPPDYYTCPDCLQELYDSKDRRYRYPFINCTQCGPRYTLIKQLPYDRPNTSMVEFPLCPACQHEYQNPLDRRFHAEPIACPVCGPQLQYVENDQTISGNEPALTQTLAALNAGKVIAVKGIGGYHLMCDAGNEQAVQHLRDSKPRPDKPLAVIFPPHGEDGLATIREVAELTETETALLSEPTRPIVLIDKKPNTILADSIAPQLNQVGVFLPYSPLHHVLISDFGRPLVATSANISGEPVLTDNTEVAQRLSQVAEAYLHHNRPIVRPADDSVYRVIADSPRPLRLGRGYAPLESTLPLQLDKVILAVGGQMKNTIALAWENRLVISPHIGDLDSPRSLNVFEQVIADLQQLYEVQAEVVVADAHPGYASRRWAEQSGIPFKPVFHHHAHAATLPLEYGNEQPWLVFTWDGVGYGEDDTLWGGEALYGQAGNWQRVASFKPFALPGGDKAGREPWRSAAALCWQAGLDYHAPREHELIYNAWQKRLNCPTTTAVGRLFDAAAALCGLVNNASFEGQGPMWLEAMASASIATNSLPLQLTEDNILRADWTPLLRWLQDEHFSIAERASRFHATLAATLLAKAERLRERFGDFRVGLSGGVFQNKLLTEQAMALLATAGFEVYLPKTLPCNDGGLCAGQVMEYLQQQN
jgi:hydrogenase maturation protein HypF